MDEIEKRFTYQQPTEEKIKKYSVLRDKAKELAILIEELIPKCREKSLAHTKLQEVVMWANAGIALN